MGELPQTPLRDPLPLTPVPVGRWVTARVWHAFGLCEAPEPVQREGDEIGAPELSLAPTPIVGQNPNTGPVTSGIAPRGAAVTHHHHRRYSMTAGTLNLYVGQTKTPTYDLLAPTGAPTPPPGPTFTLDNASIATATNGTVSGILGFPTKFTVPVSIVGVAVGDGILSTAVNGVDQGPNGQINVIVTEPPADTGAWDASTLS